MDDEADLRALALRENLPTHHVFFTYEDHTTNIVSDNPHSIKSLHIDMNVVDELSPLDDNIVGQGTINLTMNACLNTSSKDEDSPGSPRTLQSSNSSDSGLASPGCSPRHGEPQQENLNSASAEPETQNLNLPLPLATSVGPCVVTVTMPVDVRAQNDAKVGWNTIILV